jgi:hypothetical protein
MNGPQVASLFLVGAGLVLGYASTVYFSDWVCTYDSGCVIYHYWPGALMGAAIALTGFVLAHLQRALGAHAQLERSLAV